MAKKRGNLVYFLLVCSALAIAIILLNFLTATGFAVRDIQLPKHTLYLGLELSKEKGVIEKKINLQEVSQTSFLKSVRVTGKGVGFFKVWLETPKQKLLIIDSSAVKTHGLWRGQILSPAEMKKNVFRRPAISITGFAVKENSNQNNGGGQGNNGNGNNGNEGNNGNGNEGNGNNGDGNNGQNSEQDGADGGDADGDSGQGNGNEQNTDSGDTDTNTNDDSSNPDAPNTEPTIQQPQPPHVESRAKLERKLSQIYGPSWVTQQNKKDLQHANEPQKLFETKHFEQACVGTCSLPAGINDQQFNLRVELDGDISFRQLDYTVQPVSQSIITQSLDRMQKLFSKQSTVQTLSPTSQPRTTASRLTGFASAEISQPPVEFSLFATAFIAILVVFGVVLLTFCQEPPAKSNGVK